MLSFVMRPAWWPAAAAALSHSFCSSSSVEDVVVVMSELKMLGLNAGLEASSTATAGPIQYRSTSNTTMVEFIFRLEKRLELFLFLIHIS